MATTTDDVKALSSTEWANITDTKLQDLLDHAERLIDNQLSEKTATFSTIEGNKDDATALLCAHLAELAEGGESQSENTQGGSVSYNTVTGEWQHSLSETRYGRMLQDLYLRGRSGIGMVRTYPRR